MLCTGVRFPSPITNAATRARLAGRTFRRGLRPLHGARLEQRHHKVRLLEHGRGIHAQLLQLRLDRRHLHPCHLRSFRIDPCSRLRSRRWRRRRRRRRRGGGGRRWWCGGWRWRQPSLFQEAAELILLKGNAAPAHSSLVELRLEVLGAHAARFRSAGHDKSAHGIIRARGRRHQRSDRTFLDPALRNQGPSFSDLAARKGRSTDCARVRRRHHLFCL